MSCSVVFAMNITQVKNLGEPSDKYNYPHGYIQYVRDEQGNQLCFKRSGNGNYPSTQIVKLISRDGRFDYLSFPYTYRMHITEIRTSNPTKVFWLLEGSIGESGGYTTGMWLIGNNQGKYVTYVSLDGIQNAGMPTETQLLFEYNNDGTIKINGRKDGFFPDKVGHQYWIIGSVKLFWDEDAQWFGISNFVSEPNIRMDGKGGLS